MDFSGLPRNSLVKSLVVRRNRWHLYQDSGADSKWRRIYDGRERLAPQLSHPLAPARRTARKQLIPSVVQSFRFGLGWPARPRSDSLPACDALQARSEVCQRFLPENL